MTQRDLLNRIKPSYDVANPPGGVRLQVGTVAVALKVTISEMAEACDISRTSLARVLTNEWPARAKPYECDAIRQTLAALLARHGATPDQLATLWHAHGVRPSQAARTTTGRQPTRTHPAAVQATEDEDTEMLLPKQTLLPATRRHFKLATNPFDGDVLRDEQMFNGDDIRYVRESAWQCCRNGGFMAVVGESGAGKTTIQTDLEDRIAHASEQVTVIKPSVLGMEVKDRDGTQLRSSDILHAIISQLEPTRSMPQTLQARTVAAQKVLTASAALGNLHLLVVEEAHSMPDATLKHLKRLHELRVGRRALLAILLIAQPELKGRLARGLVDGSLREVAQRCEIVELLPLDSDLRGYLEIRAAGANVRLDSLMDAGAVDALRTRLTFSKNGKTTSICYPLAVNNLLTKCLNRAAEIGMPLITADLVMTA